MEKKHQDWQSITEPVCNSTTCEVANSIQLLLVLTQGQVNTMLH